MCVVLWTYGPVVACKTGEAVPGSKPQGTAQLGSVGQRHCRDMLEGMLVLPTISGDQGVRRLWALRARGNAIVSAGAWVLGCQWCLCPGRGVGFSFIFSWLLMLLVLITFVLGGNTYALLCESWRSQQLFQVSSPWSPEPQLPF